MRMDVLLNLSAADGEHGREIGAIVARTRAAGGVELDIGPADGSPLLRFTLTSSEAARLMATVQAVINGRREEIMLAED